jgi:hypothetical protein
MGLGGQEVAGKVVTVQAELPEDVDGILDVIRKILLMGEVQSITLQDGQPVTYKRFVRNGEEVKAEESTQSFVELSSFDVVRNSAMEEWDPGEGPTAPGDQLVWMFSQLAVKGWTVTHLLLSESTTFWKWLGFPQLMVDNLNQFLGARIEQDKQVPPEVFLLCGAKARGATIAEVGFVLKGTAHE